MADVKWIKIAINMFDNRKIRQIETMPDGDSLLLIWVKLLCLAGNVNDGGYIYLTKEIPYTDEMLATQFNKPLPTIRLALKTFEQFGMIEVINNMILLSSWQKYQNTDKLEEMREKNRARQKRYYDRQKEKLLAEHNLTLGITSSNALDIDKDIDRDIEKDLSNLSYAAEAENLSTFQQHPTLQEVQEFVKQKNLHINVLKFYDYYEKTGWKTKSGQPITNWKGKVYQWASTEGIPHKKKQEDFVSENADAYASLIYNLDEPFGKR